MPENLSPTNFKRSAVLFSICLMVFIDAIGTGLILPIMPTLFMDHIHGLINYGYIKYSHLFYGLSFALFPLGGLFGMPILGSLSDKIGRKKVLLIGLVLMITSYSLSVIAVLSHSIWLFLFARLLGGVGSGTYSVANAALIDISYSDAAVVNNLKYPTLAFILGFIMGPSFSMLNVSSKISLLLITPFVITLGLAIINLLFLIWTFPIIPIKSTANSSLLKSVMIAFIRNVRGMMDYGNMRKLIIAYFCFQLASNLIFQSLTLYLNKDFNYSSTQIGKFFVVMSISMAISMFGLHAALRKYFKTYSQIKYAMLFIMLAILILPISKLLLSGQLAKSIILWGANIIIYLAIPFISLNMMNIFSRQVPQENRGELMGQLGVVSAVGAILGSLIIGGLTSYNIWIIQLLTFLVMLFGSKLLAASSTMLKSV